MPLKINRAAPMHTAKAAVGGIAAAFSDLVTYLLVANVPGLGSLPFDQQQNLEYVVAGAMVWAAVYFTPNGDQR